MNNELKKWCLFLLMNMFGTTLFAHDLAVENADGVTIYYNWINNKTELGVCCKGSSYDEYKNEYSGSVVIPEYVGYEGVIYNVTSIIEGAFYGCSELTSIIIPNNVLSIGNYAFHLCTKLPSVIIPNNVISIGDYAFQGCISLTSIAIPNSVTSIGEYAFSGCTNLSSVFIGTGIENIGSDPFSSCNNLNEIHISDIKSWVSINFNTHNNPLKQAHHLYLNEEEIKDLIIPEGVTSIGSYAFDGCYGLTSVTIPNGVTTIGNNAFNSCSYMVSITIPNSVTTIEKQAFMNCNSLATITIPDGVTTIGVSAFYQCSQLTSVSLPNTLLGIQDATFYGCSSLTSITIPNGVKVIGKNAFQSCSSLSSVTIPNSVGDIFEYAFRYCSSLISIIIPEGSLSISSGLFSGCTSLSSVTIPNSTTTIGKNAFENCTSLTSVTIPNGVERIYESAFFGCTGLTSLSIGNNVIDIRRAAFYGCSSLSSVIIPNNVQTIAENSFSGCTGLTTLTIGKSINAIGSEAFNGCIGLKDVNCYAQNVPLTSSDSFNNSNIENAVLHVPGKVIDLYKESIPWNKFKEILKINLPEHTLFYIVDGEVYKKYNIEEGDNITPEAAPTKEGYTFSGWSEIPETMPAHDVTVTGSYTVNTYKLTYVVDGAEYAVYDYNYGIDITPEPIPAKVGYTFSGWSAIPTTMPARNVTVTGTFSINNYKLTYMIDGKVYKEVTYEYGANITPEPTPEGDYESFDWTELPKTMPAYDVVVNASYTTGISDLLMSGKKDVRIYSPNGKLLNRPQKGINIIKYKDGTTKIVVIK